MQRWIAEIADPDIDVYVVEHTGIISGFAAPRGNELLHFGTAVDTWGTGLAVAVHDEILVHLAAAGHRLVRLRVFEENHRAISFYRKLGWRATGARSTTAARKARTLGQLSLRAAALAWRVPPRDLAAVSAEICDVPAGR
jgi:RimJ/RimL family protein N-acetyltransferase